MHSRTCPGSDMTQAGGCGVSSSLVSVIDFVLDRHGGAKTGSCSQACNHHRHTKAQKHSLGGVGNKNGVQGLLNLPSNRNAYINSSKCSAPTRCCDLTQPHAGMMRPMTLDDTMMRLKRGAQEREGKLGHRVCLICIGREAFCSCGIRVQPAVVQFVQRYSSIIIVVVQQYVVLHVKFGGPPLPPFYALLRVTLQLRIDAEQ